MIDHTDWSIIDHEYGGGYRDSGGPNAPPPSANRHPAYRHSLAVRRAEIAGRPIRAPLSRAAATVNDS